MIRSIIHFMDVDEINADIEMTDNSSKIKLTLVAGNRDTQAIVINADLRRFTSFKFCGIDLIPKGRKK